MLRNRFYLGEVVYRVDEYKGRRTEYRYYRCASRSRGVTCPRAPYVNAEEVEAEVEAYLLQLSLRPEDRQAIETVANQLLPDDRPRERDDARCIKQELERLKDLYRFGDIDRDEYLKERDRLQDDLPAARLRKARRMEQVSAMLINLDAIWQAATPRERHKLVSEIVNEVQLSTVEVRVVPRPEDVPFFS